VTGVTLGRAAEDKKAGMTLAEVAAFVQEAYRLDVDPTVTVAARVGFSGQLQSITTKPKGPHRG
jgi:hypothetical protein